MRKRGVLHEKHQDFGFSIIVLDLGGGGQWIAPEMQKSKQLIRASRSKRRRVNVQVNRE